MARKKTGPVVDDLPIGVVTDGLGNVLVSPGPIQAAEPDSDIPVTHEVEQQVPKCQPVFSVGLPQLTDQQQQEADRLNDAAQQLAEDIDAANAELSGRMLSLDVDADHETLASTMLAARKRLWKLHQDKRGLIREAGAFVQGLAAHYDQLIQRAGKAIEQAEGSVEKALREIGFAPESEQHYDADPRGAELRFSAMVHRAKSVREAKWELRHAEGWQHDCSRKIHELADLYEHAKAELQELAKKLF